MAQFEVYNLKREKVGEVELDDSVFDVEVKEHLFWEVVRWQRAKKRRGTAKVKTRSEVRGGGAKPYRQKGTGRARQGTNRAPQFAGGGVVFGPRPRDYGYALPKKVRRGALRCALSLRARQDKLLIVEDFDLEVPKTRGLLRVLDDLGVDNVLIVDTSIEPNKKNTNLSLSSRNLQKVKYLPQIGLNVYDILRHDHLVLTKASAAEIEGRLRQ